MSDEQREKFAKMTPEQRAEFAKKLRENSSKKNENAGENSRKSPKKSHENSRKISEMTNENSRKNCAKIYAGSAKKSDIKPKFDRRPSVEIAKSFVELNVKAVIDAEKDSQLTEKERAKIAKTERKNLRKERRRKHRVRNVILSLIFVAILAAASGIIWWNTSSSALNPADKNEYQFTVASGATVDNVAVSLQKAGFIKNSLAFRIYARLNGVVINAGTFNLSPSDDVAEIAKKLGGSETATITIMIPPGITLKDLREIFKKAGFGDADIDAALNAKYDNEILAGKPQNATLEGYLYPETYTIDAKDDLKTVIEKALDQFAKIAEKDDLKNKFAKQGLNFYEGLTLASIITKEVGHPEEQAKVAGVFYNRFKENMPLQSDTTFIYAYNQGLCAAATTDCDSKYNTYQVSGLPPGPIANPSESALLAAANPTASDDLYFVAGADGVTRYAKTYDEQLANQEQFGLSGE